MKASTVLSAVALALTLTVCTQAVRADTRDATCEVRKDGDKQKGKSGPCTFGQRQGYIDIDLKNGDTVALRPADKADHFKDQHGNKVVRTQSGGSSQAFKWENGKHINVTFNAATYNHDKHQQSGYTPIARMARARSTHGRPVAAARTTTRPRRSSWEPTARAR